MENQSVESASSDLIIISCLLYLLTGLKTAILAPSQHIKPGLIRHAHPCTDKGFDENCFWHIALLQCSDQFSQSTESFSSSHNRLKTYSWEIALVMVKPIRGYKPIIQSPQPLSWVITVQSEIGIQCSVVKVKAIDSAPNTTIIPSTQASWEYMDWNKLLLCLPCVLPHLSPSTHPLSLSFTSVAPHLLFFMK